MAFWATVVVILFLSVRVGIAVHQYREQKLAIHDVERLEGWMATDSGGPNWIRQRFGERALKVFDRVKTVELDGRPAIDSDLDHFGGLTDVTFLKLNGTRITDAGLSRLG